LNKKKIILKFLLINLLHHNLLNKNLKKKSILKNLLIYKFTKKFKIIKNSIKNFCFFTHRSFGTTKKFGVSRLQLRFLMQFGILPGFKKAVW